MRIMQKRVTNAALAVLLAVASLVGGVVLPERALATGEDISTVVNKAATLNEPVAITDLSISGTGNDSVTVALSAQHGTFAFGSEEATVAGANSGNASVTGARDDVNATLATLTYTPTSLGADTITVDLGSNVTGVIIDPVGHHAYKIIQGSLSWNQARVAAKQLVYGGVQGYLANITSDTEDQFIVEHLTGNGWIGASDQGTEGDWKWMDGPEADTSFWSGNSAANGGHAVLGPGDIPYYNHWNSSEPNNSSNEDCAEYIVGQGWNDLNCDSQFRNYVVEFGAAEVPDPVTKQFTITAAGPVTNVATCAELMAIDSDNRYDTITLTADINCQGVEAHPLIGGEDEFRGTFNGNGHTIRNVMINEESGWNVALFAQSNSATFKDVTLSNFTVSGEGRVAALVGYAYGATTVESVKTADVSIEATASRIGGLIGQIDTDQASHIIGSSVDGGSIKCVNTESGCSMVGGLVGYAVAYDGGSLLVEKSYSNVTISSENETYGSDTMGGLIGFVDIDQEEESQGASATLRDVYSWSTINNPNGYYNGGLVGYVQMHSDYSAYPASFTIQRAYVSGDVTGRDMVGGLVGMIYNQDNGAVSLQNVFAMGKVVATETEGELHQGSLIGNAYDLAVGEGLSATGAYYDQTRTAQDTAGNADGLDDEATVINADGEQATYFMNNTTNVPLNAWDFEDVWVKNTSVPPTFKLYVAPDDSDDNGDGIADRLQNNVASFTSPVNTKRVVVQLSDTCDITQASAAAESSTSGDAGYTYAGGLVSFDADCTSSGTQVVLYQYGVSADDIVVRKFNPATGAYFTIDGATINNVTINGQQVVKAVYTIVDNGALDLNKTTGKISDPVGLGVLAVGAPNTGLGGSR